jgi:thioredoxin-like negative regulator of GroEL
VLQRRHNHDTFKLVRVDVEERPELARRFQVERVPAVLVVEDKRVRLRLEGPRGCRELEEALRPWLR